jgi:branched-chain amino acid transport system ATP-binding protein
MTLTIRGLSVAIAGTPVLRNVSLTVEPGQTLALVGRNGAGKTTLLRAVMGLLPPEAGTVRLAEQDILAIPDHHRAAAGIGYAPEERRLIGRFTVRDNLLLPAWAQQLTPSESARRLALVDTILPELGSISERLGGLISGGQQKMVALGRALMSGTRLVLLDEPFQGLAPALAQQYGTALRMLRSQRPELGIIVTESNPALLAGLSDRTVTIERGEIIADDQHPQSNRENAGFPSIF